MPDEFSITLTPDMLFTDWPADMIDGVDGKQQTVAPQTVAQKLDHLAQLTAARDGMEQERQAKRSAILSQVQEELDEADSVHAAGIAHAESSIATLEKEIKADVLAHGESVKGRTIHAIWSKGREGGWDNAALKGYAAAHPEILPFKKPDGEPGVSFRVIK